MIVRAETASRPGLFCVVGLLCCCSLLAVGLTLRFGWPGVFGGSAAAGLNNHLFERNQLICSQSVGREGIRDYFDAANTGGEAKVTGQQACVLKGGTFVGVLLPAGARVEGGLLEAYLGVGKGRDVGIEGLRVDFEWYAIRKAKSGDLEQLPGHQKVDDTLEAPLHSALYFDNCNFDQVNDYTYLTNGIQGNIEDCYTKEFISWKTSEPKEEIFIAIKLLGVTDMDGKVIEDSLFNNLTLQIRTYDPYSTDTQNWTKLLFCTVIGVSLYVYQRSLDQSGSRQRLSFQLFIKYLSLIGIIGHIPLLTARPSSPVYLIFASCLLAALFQSYFNTIFLIMVETVAKDLGFQPATKNTAIKKLYFLCTFVFFSGFRITFFEEWGKPTSERKHQLFSLHRLFGIGNFSIGTFTVGFVCLNLIRSWKRYSDLDWRSRSFLFAATGFAPAYLLALLIPAQVFHRILAIQLIQIAVVAVYIVTLSWLFSGSLYVSGLKVNESSIASSRGQSRTDGKNDQSSKNTDQYDPGQPKSTEEHSFNPRKVEDSIDSSTFDPEQFDPNIQKPKKTTSNPNSLDDDAVARYGSPNKSTHISPTKHTEKLFGAQGLSTAAENNHVLPQTQQQAEPEEDPGEISYDLEHEEA